jgi:hypothetical protein
MKGQQKQREADRVAVKILQVENAELRAKLDTVLERLERLEAERK